jgi:hypothetical protein
MPISTRPIPWVLFAACALASEGFGQPIPDIGGEPIHTEYDHFGGPGSPIDTDLWSYVFDASSPTPPGFLLGDDDMLFAYLIENNESSLSVESFWVSNPMLALIHTVGYESEIIPPGFDPLLLEAPFIYGYSGTAQKTIYTFFDMLDPYATLDAGEWSLVWYIADATDWTQGLAGLGGETNFVPVPIPGPGALALLGVAGLLRRNRHR